MRLNPHGLIIFGVQISPCTFWGDTNIQSVSAGSLPQSDWCPYENRRTQTRTPGRPRGHEGRRPCPRGGERPQRELAGGHLDLRPQPLRLECLLSQPPLWCSVAEQTWSAPPGRPRAGHRGRQDRQGHCPRDAYILAWPQGCMAGVTTDPGGRWTGRCPLAVREWEAWLSWRLKPQEEFWAGESVQTASYKGGRGAFSERTVQQSWGAQSQARSGTADSSRVCLEEPDGRNDVVRSREAPGLICSVGRSFWQHRGERVSVGKNWPLWGAGRGCGVHQADRLQAWPRRQSEQSGEDSGGHRGSGSGTQCAGLVAPSHRKTPGAELGSGERGRYVDVLGCVVWSEAPWDRHLGISPGDSAVYGRMAVAALGLPAERAAEWHPLLAPSLLELTPGTCPIPKSMPQNHQSLRELSCMVSAASETARTRSPRRALCSRESKRKTRPASLPGQPSMPWDPPGTLPPMPRSRCGCERPAIQRLLVTSGVSVHRPPTSAQHMASPTRDLTSSPALPGAARAGLHLSPP